MKPHLVNSAFSGISADLLVIGIFQGEDGAELLKEYDSKFPPAFLEAIAETCKAESFKGKSKESISFFSSSQIAARRLVLQGLGKKEEYSTTTARKTAAMLSRHFGAKENYKNVALDLRSDGRADFIQAAVEGWLLGAYTFDVYKSTKEEDAPKSKTEDVSFVDRKIASDAFEQSCTTGKTIAESTNFARSLIAEPACVMTPTRLAQAAESLTGANVTCEILEADALAKLGMGAYLGVSKGSHEPPKFISLKYSPKKSKKFVILVGKGVTFDSGGLSLKTAQGMETMKYDMAGAAAVLAVIKAISELKAPITVHAIVAACENMPGGNALRPGDVLKAMNGKTIEVNNTDAEGRLTLADALHYACQLKPDAIIDIATLTGAVVTALGKAAAGIMGSNDELIAKLIAAGGKSGEKMWQLPLFDEYKEGLKSDVADLKNAGARGEAGSSSAGMFLREFVDGIPWAHLDIAGAGWQDRDREELNKGGTAFGVRSLCYFLLSESEMSNN